MNQVMSHKNTRLVDREYLSRLPEPVAQSDVHLPIAHISVVEELERQFLDSGFRLKSESFAVTKDDARIFGVLVFSAHASLHWAPDFSAALGFRQANDRSMSLQAVAGVSVFVCDNLALHGELIALKRRHTNGLVLEGEVAGCLEKFTTHFSQLTDGIAKLKEQELTDSEAKGFMVDAAERQIISFSTVPQVLKEWREPRHPEFRERTRWSLHNCFTEVLKQAPEPKRLRATQELGKLFGV